MNLMINVDVGDLAKAERFYCEAFDLRVGRRLGASIVELVGSDAPVYLLQKNAGTAAGNQRRSYERHWTPVHLDFVVDRLEPAVAKAVAAGAVSEGMVEHSFERLAFLSDPFGNGFCFVEFVGGGYDDIST